jgi:ADP-ribosyl-[dinitrogen reductase] hydrolase
MPVKTSATHPIQIGLLPVTGGGRIGLTFCPGKYHPDGFSGSWARDLCMDLDAVAAIGARALVTLMELHELQRVRVERLEHAVAERHMRWFHLPIVDLSIPDETFERAWASASPDLHKLLDAGESIVIHCLGGLGRTGTIAARVLIERGEEPEAALARVRVARPGAVETHAQMRYVLERGWKTE